MAQEPEAPPPPPERPDVQMVGKLLIRSDDPKNVETR